MALGNYYALLPSGELVCDSEKKKKKIEIYLFF